MYDRINRSKQIAGFVCLAIFLLAIVSCAAWKVSPEHSYLKALKHFNNTVEIYLDNYDIQSPEIQAKWKEQIDPLITSTDQALDVWGTMINDSQAQIDYQKTFGTLIQALLDIGIVEIKEN